MLSQTRSLTMLKMLCLFLFVCVCLQMASCQPDTNDHVSSFLDPPDCGVRTSHVRLTRKPPRKIVGGVNVALGQYPWMALLGYNTRLGHQWLCSGSLISVRHVLTAAHCIYNRENNLYVVRLGELDYAREDDGAQPADFLIKTMIVHEQYDPNTSSNDIGLLILQGNVAFTDLIRPICIPKGEWKNETFEGYTSYIAGWGRTSYRGPVASHLQAVELPVRNNSACVEAFQSYKGRMIDERVMCVGHKDGGQDSCLGDSGGPLMQPLGWNNGQYFMTTGVISYGLQCGHFGIYTRITNFLPWIEEKVLGVIGGTLTVSQKSPV